MRARPGDQRVAVVTIARGRHDHLRHQVRSLARQPPDLFVLVSMDDPELVGVLGRERPAAPQVLVREVRLSDGELPLAAARNLGAATALREGVDLLVFLDVDCVVGPGMVDGYAAAAKACAGSGGPVVLSGHVGYLPEDADLDVLAPEELHRVARPHPARPVLDPGELRRADDLDLFWSLSFAMTAADWDRVGGFDEAYAGYGGEDTDFGQRVLRARGSMTWVGAAPAYHQHHPSSVPPVQHVVSIVRNANLFHRRWGWFPMSGWLEELERTGLIDQGGPDGEWRVR